MLAYDPRASEQTNYIYRDIEFRWVRDAREIFLDRFFLTLGLGNLVSLHGVEGYGNW